jgi:hypothetical protein
MLSAFNQIPPPLDHRRGLINLGGQALKLIFGTATISDVHELHNEFENLRERNDDIAHSLANQLTYVKELHTVTAVNTDSIVNLSNILRGSLVQSHDQYQQILRDIMYLNITAFSQSEIFTNIREMEFILLQLVQQIDSLIEAIQCAIKGNLHFQLVAPTTLQSILRNFTLHLPDSYELIYGTKLEDIHFYYQMTRVAIVADRHCDKLLLSVPLKAAAHHFTLYKIIILPEQVGMDKFIRYTVDYPYLAMQVGLRDYTLLSEVEYQQCTKGNPAVCPANEVIYSTQRLTCEISLYFQTVSQYHLCKRELMLQHQAPMMLQHHAVWVYHFPTPHRVTMLCPSAQDLSPRTELLMGSGLLRNATACHVSTSNMQILPTLRGST